MKTKAKVALGGIAAAVVAVGVTLTSPKEFKCEQDPKVSTRGTCMALACDPRICLKFPTTTWERRSVIERRKLLKDAGR